MLGKLLSDFVRDGRLTVIWPDGRSSTHGRGGKEAAVRLHGWRTPLSIRMWPELVLGEAYMDGRLTVERGTLADVLEILIANYNRRRLGALARVWRFSRIMAQRVPQLHR